MTWLLIILISPAFLLLLLFPLYINFHIVSLIKHWRTIKKIDPLTTTADCKKKWQDLFLAWLVFLLLNGIFIAASGVGVIGRSGFNSLWQLALLLMLSGMAGALLGAITRRTNTISYYYPKNYRYQTLGEAVVAQVLFQGGWEEIFSKILRKIFLVFLISAFIGLVVFGLLIIGFKETISFMLKRFIAPPGF